ncbi:hypothetical protein QMG61_02880 [Cryobacterium sp. PH31-AA6]|uniref:hypothetical protein n=1 Tax=Cryobacterium sp. PH31-AA6 TaxID=3046205 RepID=UPI0024B8FE20|nr:hypothetical protein [Cryobacterium sp. PH31-AA6]MDJ0322708.1 hypothetical protein [Cryobacterium sp. PH31-AA6]
MTSETSTLAGDSAHAEHHHDGGDPFDELRQRRLTLFRERQIDLEADDAMAGR